MKLEEVLPALRAGKKIRREAWYPKANIYINEGMLKPTIYLHDETNIIVINDIDRVIEVEDILKEDWEVVE